MKEVLETGYIPRIPPWWVRISRTRFFKWWDEDKKFWIGVGRQRAVFPFCACAIDEENFTVIHLCSIHEEWKRGDLESTTPPCHE